MSKRRNRKAKPNLPEEVLARARRDAGLEDEPVEVVEEVVEEVEEAPRRRRREEMPQPRVERRKRQRMRRAGRTHGAKRSPTGWHTRPKQSR